MIAAGWVMRFGEEVILKALDRLDPPRCLFCGSAGFGHLDICHACCQEWPDAINPCPRCALPWSDRLCATCSTTPPPWQVAVIPFRYVPPVATLVAGLKYRDRFMVARILGHLFCERYEQACDTASRPQLMIPVPLHYSKQRRRGFNQSCTVARHMAAYLGVRLAPRVLWRHEATSSQVGLSGAARRRNVQGAFTASPVVRNRHVALFDDVVTTGATAVAATAALLAAGAARVDLWAVARSDGPLSALR